MSSRILYVVARDKQHAEEQLLTAGINPGVCGKREDADRQVKYVNETYGTAYKVFSGRVTVEILED